MRNSDQVYIELSHRLLTLEKRITLITGGGGGTPDPHAASHEDGGTDELSVLDLGGFPGGTTTFLRADASFATPSVGGVGDLLDYVFIRKPGDEALDTTITIQADDDLVVPVGASEVWTFEFFVVYTTVTAADFRCGLTFPTTPTEISYYIQGNDLASSNSGSGIQSPQVIQIHAVADAVAGAQFGGDSNKSVVTLRGYLRNSTNAGNITLMWAQAASSGSSTTVKAGSWVEARRVA